MSMSRKAGRTSLSICRSRTRERPARSNSNRRDSVRVLLAGESPEWLTPETRSPVNASRRCAHCARNSMRTETDAGRGGLDRRACAKPPISKPPKDKSARVIVVVHAIGQRFGWRLDERPLWAALQDASATGHDPHAASACNSVGTRSGHGQHLREPDRMRRARLVARNQALNFTAHVQNPGQQPERQRCSPRLARERPTAGRHHDARTRARREHERSASATSFTTPGISDVTCHLEAMDALRRRQ